MYGYWNNLVLKPINGLIYIASNHNLIEKFGVLTDKALFEFYNLEKIPKLTFCPYTYAASNYEKCKLLVNPCKKVVCADYENDESRLAKHYIRLGYAEKLNTHSFDKWYYLANNYKRIRALMPRNKSGKIIWDIYALSSKMVANDYCRRVKKTYNNKFNSIQFVKTFIDDEYVNASKKLAIDNAPEYFVTYYVLSKDVRYKTSYISKILSFLQDRTTDTMKQIPINATRFMIETKCL
tara:strand:- start:5232 stop:5942 length:711 start_codon:yes stop_codon:yes gene_type:complete